MPPHIIHRATASFDAVGLLMIAVGAVVIVVVGLVFSF